jgi:hypothetical protein
MKEEFKSELKENKGEKEKKVGKGSSIEKSKKEYGSPSLTRHEEDTKKSKSDEKRERESKVKPKLGEKG